MLKHELQRSTLMGVLPS